MSTFEQKFWYSRRRQNTICAFNTFLLGSPFECDYIEVTPSLYFTEFEFKTSRADFRADFQKRRGSVNKHDMLSNAHLPEDRFRWRPSPIPKHFYFVSPSRLLPLTIIPAHAGLIESDEKGYFKITKRAPRIKHAAPLTPEAVFNLSVKIGFKQCRRHIERQLPQVIGEITES